MGEGRLELPETCVDAPGVDRAKRYAQIGAAALTFFDRIRSGLGSGQNSRSASVARVRIVIE